MKPTRSLRVFVREIRLEDAGDVAELSGELGYPVSPPDMAQRIHAQLQLRDHVTYLACIGGRVVGWIDVGVTHHLQADTLAEIGGFVVSGEVRSSGIGKQLLARAEQWASERGLRRMLVRSQIARDRAHRFYLREGYKQTKVSAVFTKDLG
ncbi:MAG TPA: GNAT family N-acetyltransferase [Bryobacteraceae bacterium]|nr:GNAT family N-acetyltransferase [Bryobacteraceae bacterium]